MSERQYPRWIHHPDGRSIIVQSEAHERSYGDGWFDSPAFFHNQEAPAAEQAKPTEPETTEKRGPGRPRKA